MFTIGTLTAIGINPTLVIELDDDDGCGLERGLYTTESEEEEEEDEEEEEGSSASGGKVALGSCSKRAGFC